MSNPPERIPTPSYFDYDFPESEQKKPSCFDRQKDWDAWCFLDKKQVNRPFKQLAGHIFDPCIDCWREKQLEKIEQGKCDNFMEEMPAYTEYKLREDLQIYSKRCVSCGKVKKTYCFELLPERLANGTTSRRICRTCARKSFRAKSTVL